MSSAPVPPPDPRDPPAMLRDEPGSGFTAEKALAPYSNPVVLLGLVILTLAALIVFRRAPWIDLAASELFFRVEACVGAVQQPARCGWFPITFQPSWMMARRVLQALPIAAVTAVLVTLGWNHRRARLPDGWAAAALVVLASGAVSCILVADLLFKGFVGRPRPVHIGLFGGPDSFVPVGQISTMCGSNCSFVSSEGAAGFFLVTLVVLVPKAWQRPIFALCVALGVFTSGLRVAFGAHFLSDVVIGALLPFIVLSCFATARRMLVRCAGKAERAS